jgi:hypothetical protein
MLEGEKLTCTVMGRDGTETAIQEGQFKDGVVSFQVTRERGDQKFTSKYKGKLEGDVIKGAMEFSFGDQTRSRDWEAKRIKTAADAAGTWKWSVTTQSGQTIESTLKLKVEGDKLTGTLTGRGGTETAIQEAKFSDGVVSFQVTRERGDRKFISKYKGNLAGDVIKGAIESSFGDQTRSRDWEAKRVKPVAEAAGTWKWSFTRPDGQTMESTLKLKQDGEKLTGVWVRRDGQEVAIEEGKIKGKEVSFQITRERDGNKFVMKYSGQVEGDEIKGKISGTFGGEERSFDWNAKRAKE